MRMQQVRVIGLFLLACVTAAAAQENTAREEFSAILSNISNVGNAGITPLTIRINRWTSDAENERVLGILRD